MSLVKNVVGLFAILIILWLSLVGLILLFAIPTVRVKDIDELSFSISEIQQKEDYFSYRLANDKIVIYLHSTEQYSINDSFSLKRD